MNKILILGSSGFLGNSLIEFFKDTHYEVFGQSRYPGMDAQCDPANIDEITNLISGLNPDVIINLIANTNVDLCQKNKNIAFESNVLPAINLIKVLRYLKKKVRIIHISTDHVYDGEGFKKENEVNPLNVYALTKLEAERIILDYGGLIIRTNFIGKNFNNKKKSLTDWIYYSLIKGEEITVFENIKINPLNVKTLCSYLSLTIEKKKDGIFNLGSSDGITKASLAFLFANELRLKSELLRNGKFIPRSNQSIRPYDMRMDTSKFQSHFEVNLPSIKEQVIMCASEYDKVKI
jgi:dTDP-4-dehydrorhamnose reductase